MDYHRRIPASGPFNGGRQSGRCIDHDKVPRAKETAKIPEMRMLKRIGLSYEKTDSVSLKTAFLRRLGRRKLWGEPGGRAWRGEHVHHVELWATSKSALR